ncbi:hypothetical protein M501DRAFT_1049268 [Patellaria atrata CBS 101060]|uniref:DUF567-domain-containing protein n=1 Tax=Patellaria atrata CBS 101060 TaxID=1346257 RepID=A0A9P4VU45_9PEZI|nr:hypothetical protein M501DRAFT_1049268 [Patellaria atrata CBS 101060]
MATLPQQVPPQPQFASNMPQVVPQAAPGAGHQHQPLKTAHLSSVGTEIGIFKPFIAQKSETLILTERFGLSGDSFRIQNLEGRPILQVEGKVATISGRKIVRDMAGNELFHIRKKHLALFQTFYAEDSKGERFFEVKGKFALLGSKAVGTFRGFSGEEHRLTMEGNWLNSKADIVDEATGKTVATINRKRWNARDLIGGQQTYQVTIAPGMDMALIVAMCIMLDERRNEK